MTHLARLTRHRITAAVASLALVAGLAACSNDENDTTPGNDNASSAESSDGAFPTTIETKFGDVEVKERPQRIVALGWGDAETALAVGVQPVGASDWLSLGGDGTGPWVKDGYEKAPEIIGTTEPSYEKIAALQPDLILDVKSSGDQERYDKLKEIAPTVGVPKDGGSYLTPRDEQISMIAQAVGEKDKGDALIKQIDDKFASIKDAHPDWQGKTAAVVSKSGTGWGAYVGESERMETLTKLGFEENPKLASMQPDSTGFSVALSDETLSDADSDVVTGVAIGTTPEEAAKSGPWQALQATRDGRSVMLPNEISEAFSLSSPQSTLWMLDQMTPLLEKASKGEARQ